MSAVGVWALPGTSRWLQDLGLQVSDKKPSSGRGREHRDLSPMPSFFTRTVVEQVLVACDSAVELLGQDSRDPSPIKRGSPSSPEGAEEAELRSSLPVFWRLLQAAGSSCPAHHMSSAIVDFCAEHVRGRPGGVQVLPADLQGIPGLGMHARVSLPGERQGKVSVTIGAPALLPEFEDRYPCCDWSSLRAWAEKQETHEEVTILFAAAGNGEVACGFALTDGVRAGTVEAVNALRQSYGERCEVWVTTGDNAASANAVALALDVFPRCIRFGQSPAQKQELVQQMQAEGHEVVMFGDALSDAVALSQADIGVVMGSGASFNCDGADVVLRRHALADFVSFRHLALATRRAIFRNVAIAFLMSILGVPLCSGAVDLWGVTLPPLIAFTLMVASSVPVVASSLVLRHSPAATSSQPEDSALQAGADLAMVRETTPGRMSSLSLRSAGSETPGKVPAVGSHRSEMQSPLLQT